jgi:hypothetical protein
VAHSIAPVFQRQSRSKGYLTGMLRIRPRKVLSPAVISAFGLGPIYLSHPTLAARVSRPRGSESKPESPPA